MIDDQQELRRLKALDGYRILDTEPEATFDDLTALAAQVCAAPVALISLVGADRQWFKSACGLDQRQTARDISVCTHAIAQATTFIATVPRDPEMLPPVVAVDSLAGCKRPSRDELLAIAEVPASIPRVPEAETYAVSQAQWRLWVLMQMEQSSAAYNVPLHLELEGELRRDARQLREHPLAHFVLVHSLSGS